MLGGEKKEEERDKRLSINRPRANIHKEKWLRSLLPYELSTHSVRPTLYEERALIVSIYPSSSEERLEHVVRQAC